ncbi:MAG: hypothetical protein BGO98_24250 [Myxococcales bacterium 68-20]|nr:MAG: hypothetical protein BGO98_24250 [Myxococcales bacterium 68-20]
MERWYERWTRSRHPHPELSEAALKDKLPVQLRIIGKQLQQLCEAECTEDMWKIEERLDPEVRVEQDVPIEEVVQEYRIAVRTVRDWIKERKIDVSFAEYSYFYDAVFELTAESVRRYATHQAENVMQERAEYLAGVMHQLRNPLAALSMGVEMVSQKGSVDAEDLRRLRRSGQRLRRLVDGVLRVERFRPESTPVHPEEMYLAELVQEVMCESDADARRKGLRFEAQVDRSCRVVLDRALFFDALGNLVQNAVKFTRQGFVIVEGEEVQDYILLRVRDSGPGISKERLESLFSTIQPGSGGGAGIGLRIAQHAALVQNGHIDVESEPGMGSTFTLRLPRVVPPRGEG